MLVYPWTVGGGASVTRGDLARLVPQNYLSDGVVTFGINWWTMKLPSTRRDVVYVFNSFFFTKLRERRVIA
ncbi:hypothetical protein BDZ89DRAFT_958063 [Hymenopellis radicata]|nr:hypothetical protein BDZ89DRAFT_958063 [Hymenopellis radicata]